MTNKILDHDTQKIIYRSAVRPKKSSTPNHRLAPHGGEVSASSDPSEDKISSGSPLGDPEGSPPKQKAPTVFIRSRDEENPSGSKPMPTFDPSDLIGRTFLLPPEESGERHRAKVTRQVVEIIDQPIENIYSGVVSLRNLRLVILLGKLNNLDLWGADIGNAYLEAFTDEKLYIVAGPEFQELEGYILIFLKALYGLKSSGKRWAEVIHGILRDMKILPSKADPCIWLRKAPNLRCHEYIAVYVDDLWIAAESPSAMIQIFKTKYHLKVKGDGKLTYHLGADYFEDPDGTFVSQPRKYIDKLADTYRKLFNEDPPKVYKSPLDKNDHPELDTSEIIEGDMAAKYLTMVGQLEWLLTLGRFDIHAQVATMSRFRAAPRQGHMDRVKRIYSYAIRTKDYAIRFRTDQPDYSLLPDQDFDWTYSVYGIV